MDGRKTIARRALTGLVGAFVAGCGHAPRGPATKAASSEQTITLFHDGARVRQRVTIKATSNAQRIWYPIPAGVDPTDVALLETGDLEVSFVEGTLSEGAPTQVAFDVVAKRPGTYTTMLEYELPTLSWSATYTLTTTPTRSTVTVRGALGVLNTSGASLSHAHVSLLDQDLSSDEKPTPLDLGMVDIPMGDSRIELLANDAPRTLQTVLVYDPIGTRLDEPSPATNTDPELGAHVPISPRVIENYELPRPKSQPAGLPKGPARLFERGADGQLRLLGQTELFGPETLVATADMIAIGAVKDVTGARERRDFSSDVDTHRVTEELWITLTSKRATPVDVVVREHMYRGLNWGIGYQSVPDFQKEGAQQLAARVKVPAHGQTRIVYVVVYTEPP
ncbi:hypothetical protein BH11MYX2_BH11MYX2_01170 [soil metagenome]